MSEIRKVIILNKPFKIFEFTPVQLVLLGVATIGSLLLASKVPGEWKVGNLPAGFLIGLLIICGAIVCVKATEVKPVRWWTNLFMYKLRLMPKVFIPHVEPANVYPDPTIIETQKDAHQEFFIAESRPPAFVEFEDSE